MSTTWYKIAGLSLCIDSDLDFSQYDWGLEHFRTQEKRSDIRYVQRMIDPTLLKLTPFTQLEIEDYSKFFFLANGTWNSPFFRLPGIREYLDKNSTLTGSIAIEALDFIFQIINFSSCERMIFHFPDWEKEAANTIKGLYLLAPFLSLFGATIFHASGIVRKEKTALFLAPDGGGKTTVATKAIPGSILSDDQVILRKERDEYVAFGTPWGRTFEPDKCAPTRALFLLQQASKFQLDPIKKSDMFMYLWQEHSYSHQYLPPKLKPVAFNLFMDICKSIPTYLLQFPKDRFNWDEIDNILGN